jgi:diguanylate cyclase (GGDEF)-like protein
MEARRRQPLERRIQRRFLPFAAVGLLAPLTAVLPPQPENWTLVWTSALFEPILRDGVPIGVLAVGWSEPIGDPDIAAAQAVVLLAAEAASAIERADLLARLQALAETDELTGLPIGRTWDATARDAVSVAAAEGSRRLCVAVIDIDHFKEFNDHHGHQAGDRLLRTAAASWRGALRHGDTLARYGGEEFAVALPDCGLDEAEGVLERLRLLTPEGLTCSIGLACWDGEETDHDLLARADAALYDAKRSGRDALVVAAKPS